MIDAWIWICRWEDFQHYRPERDRAPAWIKSYTKQLDDDRYRRLSLHQRGVLDSLRIAFAQAHGKLSADTRQLSYRVGGRVAVVQLKALCDAGLIAIVSRDVLEQRLEALYNKSSPHARPRAREEGEEELEDPPTPLKGGSPNGRKRRAPKAAELVSAPRATHECAHASCSAAFYTAEDLASHTEIFHGEVVEAMP